VIASTPSSSAPPERWATDAGERDVAVLAIPPDALRDRRFDVSCRFVVAARGDGPARHGMRVEVNGAQEWARRLPTENPGHTDSMDYRFRRDVPAGQGLRVVVKTEAHGARRIALSIEAEEA
jgi:hypothetical protein